MEQTVFDRVLALFPEAKQRGDQWMARCPAHEDKQSSLSIGPGKNGGAVVKCFAGCDASSIVQAVGLTLADLMPPALPSNTGTASASPRKTISKTYAYTDKDGVLLYEVVRNEPKGFSQRRPDPINPDKWIWNLQNVRRVLYRLPDVLAAAAEGQTIYLVEGEKDADALRRLGLIATTNAGGADKWSKEFSSSLAGANVVLIPDNDEPGRKHVASAGASILQFAAFVRVLELPNLPVKGDVSDWLNVGGNVEELCFLADTAPTFDEWSARQKAQKRSMPVNAPPLDEQSVGEAAVIPSPLLRDEKGQAEYAPEQIVEILGKVGWGVAPDTHTAHAHRIREHLGRDLLYCAPLGWSIWGGKHWVLDEKEATQTAARVAGLSRAVREEAAQIYDKVALLTRAGRAEEAASLGRAAKRHLSHAKAVEATPFIAAALHQAAGMLSVSVETFDLKAWRIGFQNGVWDRGEWREHRRDDYLLALSPVAAPSSEDETAKAEWQSVLNRIIGADPDLARTFQEVVGYALSGASHLRALPWLYGPKGAGKSTVAELTMTLLGNMAATIDPKALAHDASRERLGAVIWGKRLVVCSEAGNQRIEAELLKNLTGGDRYSVGFKYKEPFTASPRHALLMVANDPPLMNAYDDALRDRVLALPCEHLLAHPEPLRLTGGVRIEAVRQDPDSPLVKGFTAWALEGLSNVFRTQEIFRAASVSTATAGFWEDMDPLTPFWVQVSVHELEAGIDKSKLRQMYDSWCVVEGNRKPFGPKQWAAACRAHGLHDVKSNAVLRWRLPANLPMPGLERDRRDSTEAISSKTLYEEKVSIEYFTENTPSSIPSIPLAVFGVINEINGTVNSEPQSDRYSGDLLTASQIHQPVENVDFAENGFEEVTI